MPANIQIDHGDIKLVDMGVTSGAQRGGGVSNPDTSLWRCQLTPRVISRNMSGNIGARKREVSAGHRAGKIEDLQIASVDELPAQRKVQSIGPANLHLKAELILREVSAA